jgi:hypothetical protein
MSDQNQNKQLATANQGQPPEQRRQGFSLKDLQLIAENITQSNLFGIKTRQQAMTLMLLCQADGLHPIQAVRKYHIVDGRPTLKSQAMLSDFLSRGGTVEWIKRDATECTAKFSHKQGGTITVTWTIEMAKSAGLASKKNWVQYPRQMLTARTISEGVNTILPEATGGFYTPEEVMDFDTAPAPTFEPESPVFSAEQIAKAEADVQKVANKVQEIGGDVDKLTKLHNWLLEREKFMPQELFQTANQIIATAFQKAGVDTEFGELIEPEVLPASDDADKKVPA